MLVLSLSGVVATSQAPAVPRTSDTQLATIKQYCAGCHSDRAKAGGVSFEGLTPESIGQHADVFEKAVRKLRGRVMPPPGAKQPDGTAVDSLVAWLEESLDKRCQARRTSPDQVVLHRLNRKEYANAVRDLLAVEVDASRAAAGRRHRRGLRQHRDRAAGVAVLHRAIRHRRARRRREGARQAGCAARRAGRSAPGPARSSRTFPALPLGTRGGILAKVDLPSDGEYRINIADMATHIWGNGMEFENPLVVTLDNKIVYQTVIGGEEDMKLYDQVQNGALDRVNARLKNIKFHATAGPHKIGVTFRRQTFRRVRRSAADVRARRRPGSFVSRELVPASGALRREGPQSDAEPRPHLHLPSGEGQSKTPEACAKEIISTLAKRAYRRPVTTDDVNELHAVLRTTA